MGQLDPDDPRDMDEGMMDDDMTLLYCSKHNAPIEFHVADQLHYAPRTMNVLLAHYDT